MELTTPKPSRSVAFPSQSNVIYRLSCDKQNPGARTAEVSGGKQVSTRGLAGKRVLLSNVCETCSLHISFSYLLFPLLSFLLLSLFSLYFFFSSCPAAVFTPFWALFLSSTVLCSLYFPFYSALSSNLFFPCSFSPLFSALLLFALSLTSQISATRKFVS